MNAPEDASQKAAKISELPLDELRQYARELGLEPSDRLDQSEILQLVRDRQVLLSELDRDAMLDVIRWMRWPVRQSAGKEALAKIIARNRSMDFEGLSHRGLVVLARLRGRSPEPDATRKDLVKSVRRSEKWAELFQRKRQEWTADLISQVIPGIDEDEKEYKFLPEEQSESAMQRHLEGGGVVGGLTRRLKGVADDYVREKLDEIEARIDRKLEEIDRRLGEWRDREVAHRLKILKITLFVSILVALLSLGYHYFVRGT
jgi:hypothetical protein